MEKFRFHHIPYRMVLIFLKFSIILRNFNCTRSITSMFPTAQISHPYKRMGFISLLNKAICISTGRFSTHIFRRSDTIALFSCSVICFYNSKKNRFFINRCRDICIQSLVLDRYLKRKIEISRISSRGEYKHFCFRNINGQFPFITIILEQI